MCVHGCKCSRSPKESIGIPGARVQGVVSHSEEVLGIERLFYKSNRDSSHLSRPYFMILFFMILLLEACIQESTPPATPFLTYSYFFFLKENSKADYKGKEVEIKDSKIESLVRELVKPIVSCVEH